MATKITTACRNTALDAMGVLFDGGTGRVNIYTGAQPANASDAATGTLLATLTLSSDAFQAASGGAMAANAIADDAAADNAGTAGWYRVYNSDETAPGSAGGAADARIDGNAGETGSGADMIFPTGEGTFNAGDIISISSFSVTLPASE